MIATTMMREMKKDTLTRSIPTTHNRIRDDRRRNRPTSPNLILLPTRSSLLLVGGSIAPFLLMLLMFLPTSMLVSSFTATTVKIGKVPKSRTLPSSGIGFYGWVQNSESGEWEWEEDDPSRMISINEQVTATATATATTTGSAGIATNVDFRATATPQLPSGKLKPKQSLGQNFLRDGNTVAKMIKAFHKDAMVATSSGSKSFVKRIIELGPGAGALTDRLVDNYGTDVLQCIEVDGRAVDILREKHPNLVVYHDDVLQVNYPAMAAAAAKECTENDDNDPNRLEPLVIIGNLPYYITSQILFALADASHYGAIACATVTMQWEVAQRMVAPTSTKDYGILSVVFQTYTSDLHIHFKIPPTVFYPQPKVDSALVGFHFLTPSELRQRLAGVRPKHFRQVVTTAFRQRRKTVRNSLKKLQVPRPEIKDNRPDDDDDGEDNDSYDDDSGETILPKEYLLEKLNSAPVPLPQQVLEAQKQGDTFALSQNLPLDWANKRPEELSPAHFVEITRLIFGDTLGDGSVDGNFNNSDLGRKVWRKVKHGV